MLRALQDIIKARQVASVHEVEKVSSCLKQCILLRAETASLTAVPLLDLMFGMQALLGIKYASLLHEIERMHCRRWARQEKKNELQSKAGTTGCGTTGYGNTRPVGAAGSSGHHQGKASSLSA
jgi:hypothetical protein